MLLTKPTIFADDFVLKSIDWLENFPWNKENSVLNEQDKYEICLNVKNFDADEIQITTSDGLLVIEARHDEKKGENGCVSMHFVRKNRLPEGCVLEEVRSRLSPDGLLVVTAPRKDVQKQDTVIPVSHQDKKKFCSKL